MTTSIPCRALFCAALLVLALPAAASAQALHKDTIRGFQFKPPKDYRSVALNPVEETIIAKYQDEAASLAQRGAGGRYNMFQVAYLPYPAPGDRDEAFMERDLEDRVLTNLEDSLGLIEVEKTKRTKVSRAAAIELELVLPNSTPEPLALYALAIEQDDGIYLFMGDSYEKRFKKVKNAFRKAAKTFKRIDREDPDERESELAQLSDQERFLREQIDKLPPGWDSLRTDRYLFLFNAEKSFVKIMGEQIEALRDEYERLYPPDEPIEAVSIVRVCNSPEEYYGYGGRPGTGGYWASRHRELVFFDMRPRTFTLAVLNHEAFHQYIYYFYGELAPHSWYNEGHGDYFAGADLTGTYRIKKYAQAPAGINRRPTIKEAARLLGQGETGRSACPPLKKLMRYHQSEYYSNANVCYAAGWALVHMLREARGMQDDWEEILPRYLENLLAARHEEAQELRDDALNDWDDLDEAEQAEHAPPPSDPAEYYTDVDVGAVQDRAYALTFGAWSDKDWARFERFFVEYVEKL